MNKSVNILTFILLAAFSLMAITVIFDLEVSNIHLRGLKYQEYIFPGFAALVLLVGALRIKNRWQGWNDMRKFSTFEFSASVSKTFKARALSFTLLEAMFITGAILLYVRMSKLDSAIVTPMIIVLLVLLVETLIYFIRIWAGGKGFRVGLSDKVIAHFGRESKLYFFEGLQRVQLHQSDLISFKYRDNLVLFLPTNVLADEDKEKFRDTLIQILEKKNIYFDDRFRNWK
jgi:hypothetical protein